MLLLFCAVPNFHISPDVAGVTDEEMQKKIVNIKKHYSFSSYCKNLVGLKDKRNNKSVDSEVRNIATMTVFLSIYTVWIATITIIVKQAVW